jgi:hypothetical protein
MQYGNVAKILLCRDQLEFYILLDTFQHLIIEFLYLSCWQVEQSLLLTVFLQLHHRFDQNVTVLF